MLKPRTPPADKIAEQRAAKWANGNPRGPDIDDFGVEWVGGASFGNRHCRNGVNCSNHQCGFAHPRHWRPNHHHSHRFGGSVSSNGSGGSSGSNGSNGGAGGVGGGRSFRTNSPPPLKAQQQLQHGPQHGPRSGGRGRSIHRGHGRGRTSTPGAKEAASILTTDD
jgi:hypothetical protein